MAYTEVELNWAAGFLEGEGCFGYYDYLMVTASQTSTREPLDKLKVMFGGYVWLASRRGQRERGRTGDRDSWVWKLTGVDALVVMLTLLPLMSQRRKDQILCAAGKALKENKYNGIHKHLG